MSRSRDKTGRAGSSKSAALHPDYVTPRGWNLYPPEHVNYQHRDSESAKTHTRRTGGERDPVNTMGTSSRAGGEKGNSMNASSNTTGETKCEASAARSFLIGLLCLFFFVLFLIIIFAIVRYACGGRGCGWGSGYGGNACSPPRRNGRRCRPGCQCAQCCPGNESDSA